MANKENAVLFLDRDGTINIDIGPEYISDPSRVKLVPGAGRAVIAAHTAGFRIAVITNQAGVAKGKTPKEALPLVHRQLEKLIAAEAGVPDFKFDDLRVCMHHPDEKCSCRKPETLMLEESIAKLSADVTRSFFVGDKMSDLLCAEEMGVRSILVRTGHGVTTEAELVAAPVAGLAGVVATLSEAVDLVLRLNAR